MAKYGSSWQLRSRDLISETCFVRHGDLPFQFAEAIQSEVADRNNSKPKVYTGEELRLRLGGQFISVVGLVSLRACGLTQISEEEHTPNLRSNPICIQAWCVVLLF